jgi:hypothetical protein
MWSYFRGWKRKIGVMTLVMACFFTAGWIRSPITFDELGVPCFRVISTNGGLYCEIVLKPFGLDFWYGSMGPNVLGRPDFYNCNDPRVWKWRGLGFAYGTFPPEDFGNPKDGVIAFRFFVPYWSVVVILTLISAWCLLTKPRPKTAAKPESADA